MRVVEPETVEACARAAHELNRVFCIACGDDSQRPWELAPDWQKDSARKGVLGALAGNTPQQSHEGWLEEKRSDGWTWGPIKDPAKKQHPCFLPYADLPPLQRMKDDLFLCAVRAVASAMGEDVEFDPLLARDYVEAFRAIVAAESPRDMHDIAQEALVRRHGVARKP